MVSAQLQNSPTCIRRVLIICKGNICRSPVAEVVLHDVAESSIEIRSRGTHSWHRGKGAHPAMVRAAAMHGFDLTKHVAQEVNEADLVWADDILSMDRECLNFLLRHFAKELVGKARLYLETGEDVPDPYGQGSAAYQAAFHLIERGAHSYLESLQHSVQGDAYSS